MKSLRGDREVYWLRSDVKFVKFYTAFFLIFVFIVVLISEWLGPTFWPIPYETVSGGFGLSVFFRFS